MQRRVLNIVAALMLLFSAHSPCFSQTSSFRLKTADSLFIAKRYTQSFDHYEKILQKKQYTPAMLLKMAFIQEGLMHIGRAMYFLNLYYIATNDKTVLEKMNALAHKYNLEGYETTESDRLLDFYQHYYRYVSISLLAVMVLLLSFSLYSRRKLKRRPVASAMASGIMAIILYAHLFYGGSITSGIVTDATTYVMDGPSAGASVLDVIGDGHRVEVLGHKDVWVKIRWEGNVAYIKENCLLPIRL